MAAAKLDFTIAETRTGSARMLRHLWTARCGCPARGNAGRHLFWMGRQTGVKNGEWPHLGAILGTPSTRRSTQIDRDNVKNRRVAWR